MKSTLSPETSSTPAATGSFVDRFGGRYYRISNCDLLPTFFMNVVSGSDLWLFLASNGGLTAGRIDAEHALFPYQPVDRIYDSAGQVGPVTALWVEQDGSRVLWEPFGRRTGKPAGLIRNLYKSVEGDRVWFEELNESLGLAFRYGWSTAADHGFIRQCELENLQDRPVKVRLLDGLRNLLPSGIPLRLQTSSSCLADAYKSAERIEGTTLAVYALAAGIVDRAIPLESLRASAVWSEGLDAPDILLCDHQLGAFFTDQPMAPEAARRGLRCSYFLSTTLTLAPRQGRDWLMVADLGLSQTEVTARLQSLRRGASASAVLAAANTSTATVRTLVAAADGLQAGAEETTAAHHFANVLFNLMRGGIFAAGYTIPGDDFAAYVRQHNRRTAERHAAFLAGLPAASDRAGLLRDIAATNDRELERLGYEYLPLTFSRRHGDPSRPWNRFSIRLRDAQGRRLLTHEGNWRDIFQNWEALCLSHPEYFESIVAKFVNASTIDGYNPYRLSHAGVDWETIDPEDPWASIGYWGDHQTIYLLKLLEWSGRFHPGRLEGWLRRDIFSYADVPYRIASYDALRRNPHVTIEFDEARHHATLARVETLGTDARLIHGPDGAVHRVNLTEKLLLLVLTRLTNFVPGGGIWMNTQRPEWNDANNALVGYGVSMVTLCYLRRMLAHVQRQCSVALGEAPVPLSAPLAALARRIQTALADHQGLLSSPAIDDRARRTLLDALASAGSDYRAHVYQHGPGASTGLAPTEITQLLTTALAFVDHTIRANRRADGLYHAYNLLEFTEQPAALKIRHLDIMLEGQVAVLSCGLLATREVADLLAALRASALYRPDQHSYLLYPDRSLPGFLARNVIPAAGAAACPLLRDLLAAGHRGLIEADAGQNLRFHADLVNGEALEARLARLAADPVWTAAIARDGDQVRSLYEQVFNHRAFTGRSGSMFGYEGLGSIYWHMVAKLLLAVQENLLHAQAAGDPAAAGLIRHYYDIRAGLGFNKTPAQYGAFPTDPYSHTPGHSGAQQPGMTGQVKEEILTRSGELGLIVTGGRVTFAPSLLRASEFTTRMTAFRHLDAAGRETVLDLAPGSLAYTFCGVPVVYHLGTGPARLTIHRQGLPAAILPGRTLDAATSNALFARDGSVLRLEVDLGADFRPLPPEDF
jgi:hypothetical protein